MWTTTRSFPTAALSFVLQAVDRARSPFPFPFRFSAFFFFCRSGTGKGTGKGNTLGVISAQHTTSCVPTSLLKGLWKTVPIGLSHFFMVRYILSP